LNLGIEFKLIFICLDVKLLIMLILMGLLNLFSECGDEIKTHNFIIGFD